MTTNVPYIWTNEAIEYSFRSLKFINATFIAEGNKTPAPKISKATRIGLQLIVKKGVSPGRKLEKYLQ